MINVGNLVKTFSSGETVAVDDVSFSVQKGEFYTLLGPSGCGKTTTLRCIAGLEKADSGTIELGGVTVLSDRVYVPAHKRDIGMVFQSYAIWPHMSVFDNVAYPLRHGHLKIPRQQVRERVQRALELVGLGEIGQRNATELSGGQQQRVSLARAVVREPSVLLLDEPLSNLDARLRERMRTEVSLLQRRLEITTLFVTHDQVEALSMSDRIAVMESGKIVQEGTPSDVYQRPATRFVANFIGSTNLIEGQALQATSDSGPVRVELPFGELTLSTTGLTHGDRITIAIRPEDVELRSWGGGSNGHEANVYRGEVMLGQFTGAYRDYLVQLPGKVIQVRTSARTEIDRGHQVQLRFPPDACIAMPDIEPRDVEV